MQGQVIQFVSEVTGVAVRNIGAETLVSDDLHIDGDDGVEFLEEFSRKFEVDMSGINKIYFGSEGFNPFTMIFNAVAAFTWGFLGKPDIYSPLPVKQLIRSAERGKWVDI